MADQEPLVPLFIPPLAFILAAAEKSKGAALTAPEVEAIRDKSPCVMMEPADAEKMSVSRGFADVNPQNVWADWHRLRSQVTGGYLPKIVLYAIGKNFTAGEAAGGARSMVAIGRKLLEAGGIAIKCESSGIAHSPARWSLLDERTGLGRAERWGALFRAYVLYPIGSEDLYTCGMHLLGAPDLIAADSLLAETTPPGSDTAATASNLFATFALYLLDECRPGAFASGHTFSLEVDSPRFRVVWEPCTGYRESDLFWNPFGRWRFIKP